MVDWVGADRTVARRVDKKTLASSDSFMTFLLLHEMSQERMGQLQEYEATQQSLYMH